jgi:hypothetical protein
MVMQNKRTAKIAILNEQIKTWVRGNYELMV